MKNKATIHNKPILSWLLHHANKLGKNEHFYRIKNKILAKYGTHVCYDVQFIEGKKCNSCRGTGIHHYYNWDGKIYDTDFCWYCHNGWYKRPTWNILAKLKFGKYEFHQPYQSIYVKPDNCIPVINGYIDHTKSKYSNLAITILFLIYDKGFLKRWYKETGTGWKNSWYLPKNWIYNIIHFIKHGSKSYPIRHAIEAIKKSKQQRIKLLKIEISDDLPF